MYHGRLRRSDLEPEMKFIRGGFQYLPVFPPRGRPATIPHPPLRETRPGDSRPRAVQSFVIVKVLTVNIRQRQVRQIQIAYTPRGPVRRRPLPLALPEKNQLESKSLARRIAQVARVIPPLRAELRMLEMILRKRVAVPRRGLPIRLARQQRACRQQSSGHACAARPHPRPPHLP